MTFTKSQMACINDERTRQWTKRRVRMKLIGKSALKWRKKNLFLFLRVNKLVFTIIVSAHTQTHTNSIGDCISNASLHSSVHRLVQKFPLQLVFCTFNCNVAAISIDIIIVAIVCTQFIFCINFSFFFFIENFGVRDDDDRHSSCNASEFTFVALVFFFIQTEIPGCFS